MATNTYVALDKVTLASNQGTVTFTNIPQTYTDLRLVIKGGFIDNGFTFGARVGNGSVDSGGNYSYQVMRGNGSVVSSYAKASMIFGAVMQQGANNLHNTVTVDFLNYSNTTTNKTWVSQYGNAGEGADFTVTTWRSTAAIDTIAIAESADGGTGAFNYGNMLAGTTFSLYGVAATSVGAKATGGDIYTDSQYYYHVFDSTGTFTPSQSLTASVLVVGTGGVGAVYAGGGGAGGSIGYSSSVSLASGTAYTATIGASGTVPKVNSSGNKVQSATASTNCSFSGGSISTVTGTAGGNGSDTGAGGSNLSFSGGSGTGGGGAGFGANGSAGTGGAGGAGVSTYSSWGAATGLGQNINGTYWFAGGGGGGTSSGASSGAGGSGGGGNGGADGFSGTAYTGGGGGGAKNSPNYGDGGAGGLGVVMIRYAKV
jgi:hypothetical protein